MNDNIVIFNFGIKIHVANCDRNWNIDNYTQHQYPTTAIAKEELEKKGYGYLGMENLGMIPIKCLRMKKRE